MFFPIRTDRRLQHTPWVNYTLIAVNVVVFILQIVLSRPGQPQWFGHGLLDPEAPSLHQFITYQFLHGSWEHLLGNMLFLYVFGNSVEDRLGKIGYLGFYLAGGVIAGLGHALLETAPVLGASGAICGVTGAYLALFPLSGVTIFYWFFFYVGTFEVSGIVLICFQIAQDLLFQLAGSSGVAYMAHLAGYAYGLLIGMGLLWCRLLAREPYDLLALIERRRRRSQFRTLTSKGYQPWQHNKPSVSLPGGAKTAPLSQQQQQVMDLRSQISTAAATDDLPSAAALYRDLLELDSGQVLSQQQQLDVANQLMAETRYDSAARAYELFLNTYKGYGQREQVELILGLIYARYLDRRQRARELLTTALGRLQNGTQKDLARRTLTEIE